MSPKDPEPIFRTNRYFPPTTNSDRQLTVALAILYGLYSHKSLAKTEQELSQGRSSQTWLVKLSDGFSANWWSSWPFFWSQTKNGWWRAKEKVTRPMKMAWIGGKKWRNLNFCRACLASWQPYYSQVCLVPRVFSLLLFLSTNFWRKKSKMSKEREMLLKAKKPNDNDSVIRQVIVKKTNGDEKRQKCWIPAVWYLLKVDFREALTYNCVRIPSPAISPRVTGEFTVTLAFQSSPPKFKLGFLLYRKSRLSCKVILKWWEFKDFVSINGWWVSQA